MGKGRLRQGSYSRDSDRKDALSLFCAGCARKDLALKRFEGVLVAGLLLTLGACAVDLPKMDSIRDSRLFDRRIQETPRQKTVRECRQEAERFRIGCTFCHVIGEEEKIVGPDKLQFTVQGQRAQIMRQSPTFGLHQQCSVCHQSKFQLTRYAEKMFGPDSARRQDLERELQKQEIK